MTEGTESLEEQATERDAREALAASKDAATKQEPPLRLDELSVEEQAAPLAAEPENAPGARRARAAATDFVSENAVPLTLAAVGAGWLAVMLARQRGRGRTRNLVSDNPISVGALAVAAGVGIALALPETEAESRVMRPVAGRLADQARGLMGHVRTDIASAREAAGRLRDTLTRPARDDAEAS